MTTKLDIPKFDGKISFSIWQVQMRAILTQHGLRKAMSAKPAGISDDQWEELDQKALSTMQLCLTTPFLAFTPCSTILAKFEDFFQIVFFGGSKRYTQALPDW